LAIYQANYRGHVKIPCEDRERLLFHSYARDCEGKKKSAPKSMFGDSNWSPPLTIGKKVSVGYKMRLVGGLSLNATRNMMCIRYYVYGDLL
jgi:hypothetical protein